MTLSRRHLPITRPCPAELDPRDGWCDHCAHEVVDLSAMTETDARALLHERRGQTLCVRYQARADETIAFAPARRAPIRFAMVAMLAVALSGCARMYEATHGHPPPDDPDVAWVTAADGCPVRPTFEPTDPAEVAGDVDPSTVVIADFIVDPNTEVFVGMIVSRSHETNFYDRRAERLEFVPTKTLIREARARWGL